MIKAARVENTVYEPLSPLGIGVYQPLTPQHLHPIAEPAVTRDLLVGRNELEIIEKNLDVGLTTSALFFTIPHEDFGGLVRKLTITNDGQRPHSLEVLDGIGWMEPYGVNDWGMKNIGRTLEGFFSVFNLKDNAILPFYHLRDSFVDSEVVTRVTEGNYIISFIEEEGEIRRLPIVVDPNRIFGNDTSLSHPMGFAHTVNLDALTGGQVVEGRTPSGFAAARFHLKAGESVTISSVYGFASSLEYLKRYIEPKIMTRGFLDKKRQEAQELVESITQAVNTKSSSEMFDGAVKQALLDNSLRGGVATLLGDPAKPAVYHVYSRRHGDLERDYNNFVVEPQFFSLGPGNFRDVAQNRRCDVFVEPAVGDFNFRQFLSLVQSDGYNPLEVKGSPFRLTKPQMKSLAISSTPNQENAHKLGGILGNPNGLFLGDMFAAIEKLNIELKVSREELVNQIATQGVQFAAAGGGDLFWSDHWTYTLDLLHTFNIVFPEKLKAVLYDAEPLPFFANSVFVLPRSRKYKLVEGAARQRAFVMQNPDVNITRDGMWKLDANNEVFKVPVVSKLFFLTVIKFATLDAFGMGVEMEGGKPGWLDAMNGMPGRFGSGMPETYEVLRHLKYLLTVNDKIKQPILIHTEFGDLLNAIGGALDKFESDKDTFAYWDTVATARETYREITKTTFKGTTIPLPTEVVTNMLKRMIIKVEDGITRANVYTAPVAPSYFMFDVTKFSLAEKIGENQYVKAEKMEVMSQPLFLEGAVRAMKNMNQTEARAQFEAVKASDLYDKELSLYKISASLKDASDDLGRVMAFAPGWLENESVWLHMSYKFYLQLLRSGLYKIFWEEFKSGCTAFMDPEIYGRNPQECSSFIVSSAHPDRYLHGGGYLARLSGSTAEFLSMYFLMMAGPKPFVEGDNGEVTVALKPAVPGWLFTKEGLLTFRYLGTADITYYNPHQADTWEMNVAHTKIADTNGAETTIDGPVYPAWVAKGLRSGAIKSMYVTLEASSHADL
eukprot:gb/GEZN01000691.1/.p1 GENE.gb/GEZN01000691.1/~~gb/GEZN01000691.1/.p1  ORF type:complete len:1158 (-),score=206.55 gb/GEZN01000691.1/:370-3381(-)